MGIVVEGANRNDHKITKTTLDAKVELAPDPRTGPRQNLCLDKGYDYPEVDRLVDEYGYTGHISRRGEDTQKRRKLPGYRARRWVVERTHSWMNRFRRLLVRWEKKVDNYLGMLHLAGVR